MFNKEFYPTPPEVIEIMLEPYKYNDAKQDKYSYYNDKYDLSDKTILEPSAGKGDILDFIAESKYNKRDKENYFAIEQNQDLQAILREKDYDVLGSDFLTWNDDLFFDLIIMNPPFSNGDEHLLKAIEISRNTEIICLLNAETILNPHSKKRKYLLQQIEEFGSYEILGDVFKNAERKTGVNVALVRLKIVLEEQAFDFSFTDYQPEKVNFDESFVKNEVARNDKIGNMMIMFEQSKRAYKELIEAQAKFEHYNSFLMGIYDSSDKVTKKDGTAENRYNYYNKSIKKIMWKKVVKELNLERYMTNKISQNFSAFINQQSSIVFNKQNVADLFNMLISNSKNILDQAITDVFEMLTANYYSENRMHVEGWKTNDRYKVNRKVIAPTYVRYGEYMNSHDLKQYGDKFSVSYSGSEQYTDIDKVMCYITGEAYEQITTIRESLDFHFNKIGKVYTGQKFDNQCESKFFKIKFYKKGTVHLYFKDKWMWNEFNMRACADKNWLPDNERSKWEQEKADKRQQRKNERNGVLSINQENTEEIRAEQLNMFF